MTTIMKPTYTEEEIDELEDLHYLHGYDKAVFDVLKFLKTIGYSDVNAVVIAIRKEFNSRCFKNHENHQEKYKNSTLIDTLCKRMDWTAEQNRKDENLEMAKRETTGDGV